MRGQLGFFSADRSVSDMFHRLSIHLSQLSIKYSAARRVFNSLLGVFDVPMKHSLVFDILQTCNQRSQTYKSR